MGAMPWVKVYTEFLDDPKIGSLPESAKLRCVQLIMLAGECDADGLLVSGDHAMTAEMIAWRLRISVEQLLADIATLTGIGVISHNDGVYEVANFAKRQGRSQEDKRAKWREWQASRRQRHADVMHDTRLTSRDVSVVEREKEREEDKDTLSQATAPETEPKAENATAIYAQAFADQLKSPPNAQQISLMAQVTDLQKWRLVLEDWKAHKWRHDNVPGMVDKYNAKPRQQQQRFIAAPNWPRRTSRRPQVPEATEAEREAVREAARKRIEERAKRKAGEV